MPQIMRWLLTVQETPRASPRLGDLPKGVDILISPLRIAVDGGADAEPPIPNCLIRLSAWPQSVELRRPDGARRSVGLRSATVHINIEYEARSARDEFGRVRNPWLGYAMVVGVQVEDVPVGSELWGLVGDEASNEYDARG